MMVDEKVDRLVVWLAVMTAAQLVEPRAAVMVVKRVETMVGLKVEV